jgi:FkbM family methyltransferase
MLHLTPKSEPIIKKKTLCFDIGANIGCWSLANIDNYDKIIAIEASSITFNDLLNNSNNKIIPLNYAVCNNNCENINFYHCYSDHVLSTINKNFYDDPNSRFHDKRFYNFTTICKSITIDKLIEIYGMPDLIKIDVESGEYDCISSLNTKNNLLCFEWSSEFSDISFKCIDHLEKLGYTKFYIQDKDDYKFIPSDNDFKYSIITTKILLLNKIHKIDWGMLWCK